MHGVALVIGDHPKRQFQTHVRTTDWWYIRFHQGGGADGDYTADELEAWTERFRRWLRDGDVYAYFNDDWAGHAVAEALRLRELVLPAGPGMRSDATPTIEA